MTDFIKFSKAITKRFDQLSKNELFVSVDGNALWAHYLASFPEGSDPLFRERTEHDCSCCKQFIRNIGTAVSIVDGKLETIWDVTGQDFPYDVVAQRMAEFVKAAPITGLFRSSEQKYGAEYTIEALDSGSTRKWNHFNGKVAPRHFTKMVDQVRGDYNTGMGVFQRGLEELSGEAIDTVVDLIQSNALYRGAEHLPAIKGFQKLKAGYRKLKTDLEKNAYVWEHAGDQGARFRNTVIGTLIQDLSSLVDLESAVKSFEAKVAPTNYKRPTALITKSMIQSAMKTIEELNLEPALDRRFAKLSDISINNVLWVDNAVQGKMKDGIEGLLMNSGAVKAPKVTTAEDISMDEFMQSIVPKATAMEVFVRGGMAGNFMSLTAPKNADTGKLLKWDNDFAWSYQGNIADSIKERVKKAGGNVTNAKLRISLAWFNSDDLDIHVYEPSGKHIYFGDKQNKLDVDMNAFGPSSLEPVENVSWISVQDGRYRVQINQFNKRGTSNVGFELEVENDGQLYNFVHEGGLSAKSTCDALDVMVVGGKVTAITPGSGVVGGGGSREIWGINTERFVKVSTLLNSPNHWDDNKVGNKHWFFILDNCQNAEPTRGIYNEFLNSGLEKHRKVFEILGDRTKCQPSTAQLSGVGFTSARGDSVKVMVTSTKARKLYNINF